MTWVFWLSISAVAVHLPARFVERELRLLDVVLALRLQIGLLRSQLQDFVLGVFLALLRIGEFATAILDVASRGVSLGQQILQSS